MNISDDQICALLALLDRIGAAQRVLIESQSERGKLGQLTTVREHLARAAGALAEIEAGGPQLTSTPLLASEAVQRV